ncbi:hypothetical protein [Saccharopolyspora endophytica]|uniref:Bacterial transcriptional activator domain-containing protein n=1 Tax=Saccharopolyspora endophytica TaxID=543886 RepID=A0ABS5DK68_9PSEU|nr:hypothetical protein [Saccharopolyspora endophytica]MBQ0926684.1 hypothetical protein [Saccharopolyspora endophytica]
MRMLVCLAARLLRVVGALAACAALVALLAGVPWGLVTFLGWPLPDHLPTSGEIESVLLNPLSVTLLLDVLACIAWPVWLVFAVDVARCIPDAVRGVRPPAIGPVHAVAGLLVATAVLGLLPRSPVAAEPATATPVQPTAAVTILDPTTTAVSAVDSPIPTHLVQQTNSASARSIVRVQSPHDGVYDSLWRIAERELGDGHRWTELFARNQGRPQPDGATLTDPHLIRPGWILHLPETAEDNTPLPRPTPPAQPPAIPTPTAPAPPPAEEAPGRPGTTEGAVAPASSTAVMLGSGGVVASTLAAAVSLGLLTRRRRRMRSYKPGSGDRTPMPAPAPAVHALRLVHDHAQLGDEAPDPDSITLPTRNPDIDLSSVEADSTHSVTDVDVGVGIREGRAYALDLAALHGLGLTGAGAAATARSLLVHLLATTSATLLIPDHDARALLGDEAPESPRLHTTTDLDEAVTALADGDTTRNTDLPGTELTRVLVSSIDRPHPRLEAVLDTGSSSGAAGILLGHWPAGATVRVRADGVVTATSPAVAELRGAQLFHLGATDTRDLLDLLIDTTHGPRPGYPAAADEAELTGDDHLDESERDAEPRVTDTHEAQPEFDADATIPVLQHQEKAPPSTTPIDEPEDAGQPDANQLADTEPAPEPPKRLLNLAVFGPLTLTWHSPETPARNLTAELAPKHKALITFLALHPHGATRASVREALWPEARGRRPYNAFYAALSQIRKALAEATDNHAADLVVQHDEHVALNTELVEVDYWQLNQAEHDRHIASTDEQRFAAWSRIVALYTGEIADGMSALWLDGPREAAHRTVLDALAGMAAHYRGHDSHKQLQLLEHARLLNPENEDIYRDIMRVQAELGLTDAISRTLHLLNTTLAEIGERPDPSTLALARTLQARQHRKAS